MNDVIFNTICCQLQEKLAQIHQKPVDALIGNLQTILQQKGLTQDQRLLAINAFVNGLGVKLDDAEG